MVILLSKSSTGVDWFVVDTEPGCAVRIHRAVDYWAKHIVEQVKNIPGVGNVSHTFRKPLCTKLYFTLREYAKFMCER